MNIKSRKRQKHAQVYSGKPRVSHDQESVFDRKIHWIQSPSLLAECPLWDKVLSLRDDTDNSIRLIQSFRNKQRQIRFVAFTFTVHVCRSCISESTCNSFSLSSSDLRTLFHPGTVSFDSSFNGLFASTIQGHQCRCSSTILKVSKMGSYVE